MTIDVVPIKRLPDHLGVFTYRVPDALAPRISRGVYVRIPFRGQEIWGIVQRMPSTVRMSGVQLRDVLGVHGDMALTDTEVEVLERAAALYRTSIATVALHAIPVPPLRSRRTACVVKHNSDRQPESAPVGTRSPLLRPGLSIACWQDYAARDAAFRTIARSVIERSRSLLCCTPHRADIPALVRLFEAVAPVIILDRVAARASAWDTAVASREATAVLIGTRAAIWHAPPTLGAIVIDRAESDDLVSWDADPRYDARAVGQWIARARNIPLVLSSPAPRAIDWARADHRVDLGISAASPHAVVDLHRHWRSGARGFITEEAHTAIDLALASERVAVVLHNRRGLAARVTCTDCGTTMTCEGCGAPYTEHPEDLQCHRCGRSSPMPMTCPGCRSPRLSSRGIGTAGIASALEREYPSAAIARVDRDAPASPPPNAHIIVGSERFLHAIAPIFARPVGAVVVVDAARFVRTDDYRASERLFQGLRNVLAWSRAWDAPCVIQSTAVDLPAIAALERPISSFYRSELAERAALRYPPATRLISCTMDAEDDLTPIRNHANVERIDGPFPARRGQRSGSKYVAIVRLRADASDDDAVSVLSIIPRTVRATVDPLSLAD